jgi:hypothetical protein
MQINKQPVRLAYQPPASSTFLSEQISQQEPANSTFLSEQTSTSHQPPANRTSRKTRRRWARQAVAGTHVSTYANVFFSDVQHGANT